MLLAPVMADSRYHYLFSADRFGDHPWNVLPWTVEDAEWRAEQGRITPVGVFYQHVLYWLGLKLAVASGTEIYVVAGAVKLGLVLASVAAFALLVGQLRRWAPPYAPAASTLPAEVRRLLVLVFAAALVLGVTTQGASNGWTTFPALCIGAGAITFGFSAVVLAVANRWPLWTRRKQLLGVVVLTAAASALVLSYEMHWAAMALALTLLAFNGRDVRRPWRRIAGDKGRLAAGSAVVAGFGVTLTAVRLVLAKVACEGSGCYSALQPNPDGPVLGTALRQLATAVPGTADGPTDTGNGETDPSTLAARLFDPPGWVWGLLLGVGVAVVAWLYLRAHASDAEAEAESQPRDVVSSLWPLALGCGLCAVATALVMSISEGAQQLITGVGVPYRSTPVLWTMYAAILAIAWTAATSRRGWTRIGPLVLAVACIAVGALVQPRNVETVQAEWATPQAQQIGEIHHQVVVGSASAPNARRRCALNRELTSRPGSDFAARMADAADTAYEFLWHRPFCDSESSREDASTRRPATRRSPGPGSRARPNGSA
jgi:hypothetical protein